MSALAHRLDNRTQTYYVIC